MSEVNFSYSVDTHFSNTKREGLFSFNGVTISAGPAGSVILHRLLNNARMIAKPELAQALMNCNHFRTIESHAHTIMEKMPALRETPDDVLSVLEAVQNAGLFESSQQMWTRLTHPKAQPNDTACRVFILTCDRPLALERIISSLCSHSLPGIVEDIWVIDDSREKQSFEENARLVASAQQRSTVAIEHFDLTRREEFIKELSELVPEHVEEIEFLIGRSYWQEQPTYGLARNLALLLSVGKRALVLDDDIILEAILPPLASQELRTGTPNQRLAMAFKRTEELNSHALVAQTSAIDMMLSHLGQPLGRLISEALPNSKALAGWDGEILSASGGESPILITQCGSWGDPGTASGNWILNLEPANIKRLLEQSYELEEMLSARATWFGYRGPVLSRYGVMSQMTGLDNTHLLPPYLPAGRGEDILFGVVAMRMYPTSLVYNEGWSIRHEPLEERSSRGRLFPIKAELSLTTLVNWLGRESEDRLGLSPMRNLLSVAEQIQRLSEMDTEAFTRLVTQELVRDASSRLCQCFDHLDQLPAFEDLPNYDGWRAFLSSTRDALVEQIQNAESDPLARIISSGEASIAVLRERGARFAAALRAWPLIRGAAVKLAS